MSGSRFPGFGFSGSNGLCGVLSGVGFVGSGSLFGDSGVRGVMDGSFGVILVMGDSLFLGYRDQERKVESEA
jgi:hypothetical protein